jgi:DNA invertase Pin-like site-specific DNA recombinase
MGNNVIIYTRVSTDEQSEQGYSMQHQEVTATAYCNVKNYKILMLIKEDYSAKSFNRPEWKKIMDFIKANKGLVNK